MRIFTLITLTFKLQPFLDWDVMFQFGQLQYTTFDDHLEISIELKCSCINNCRHSTFCPCSISALVHNTWLPQGFNVQFKMLMVTNKVFHSLGSGYLWDCSSLDIFALAVRSDRIVQHCHLMGLRRSTFFVATPACEAAFSKAHMAPPLLCFRKVD